MGNVDILILADDGELSQDEEAVCRQVEGIMGGEEDTCELTGCWQIPHALLFWEAIQFTLHY